jgi:multiple sugar transport system permease protein
VPGTDAPGAPAISRRAPPLAWGFVAPALLFLIAIDVFPLVYDVVLSFRDASLSGSRWEWTGGANYSRVFTDPMYATALRTTAFFVVAAVSIELVLGFVLALALRPVFRAKSLVTTALLVPMMLSPAVMGLYWNLVLNGDYGILNQILSGIGLPQPQWLTDDSMKMVSVILIDTWMWTPFMMLIALAGLNAIPTYIYEAAEVDRAGPWTVFTRITLPMCSPLLGLAVLFRATDALKQFDLVMAITGPTDSTTQTISALLYDQVFRNRRVGLGSAYACVVLVVVIALATVFVRYVDSLRKR